MSMSVGEVRETAFPEPLLRKVIESAVGERNGRPAAAVDSVIGCSNHLARVRLPGAGMLVIKRSPHAWGAACFEASRRAAELLRRDTTVLAPRPLPLPDEVRAPVEAYWHIDLPTLWELWPNLSERTRAGALESWGTLMREIHRIELPRYGSLGPGAERFERLADLLQHDLGERLFPATAGEWEAGADLVWRLMAVLDEVGRRTAGRRPCLLHNDLQMKNVLCEVDRTGVRCSGVLDLERATAGPPESDVAALEVLHGSLFTMPMDDASLDAIRDGYAAELDPWLIHFFHAYHLVNLGFFSAHIGDVKHAELVLDAAQTTAARVLE